MQKALKPLPIGESDINKLLAGDFVYVDKTRHVYEMVKVPSKYFLSRPRRFGKSTLLSTLYEVFRGNKELFKGQWIYTSSWTWQEYPIIRIDFNVEHRVNLIEYIRVKLKNIAIYYDVYVPEDYASLSYGLYFSSLVQSLADKYQQRVVILIDEYDKPMLDVIDDLEEAESRRDILKSFYGTMKGLDDKLRFIFLTGVSRFSKVGIFSGLNNLDDISMDRRYADVCGITQAELEYYYLDYIQELANLQSLSYDACLAKIKEWYNGFYFSRNFNLSVYNSFSTLLLFNKMEFSNYWFATGSPSFLIKLICNQPELNYEDFDGSEVWENDFDSFELNNLRLLAILFQTGYLTIKAYDDNTMSYTLSYPNREINESFKYSLLGGLSKRSDINSGYLLAILRAVNAGEIELVVENLKQVFLNIDYDVQLSQERNYQNIVYLIFQLLGFMVKTEYKTNLGRIDLLLETKTSVYIIEFKFDKNAKEALTQIKTKKYYERFLGLNKAIYLCGINFSSQNRNIDDYCYEEINLNHI